MSPLPRHRPLPAIFLSCLAACAFPARAANTPTITVGYTDAQVAYVRGWILERAPGSPPEVVQDVTNQFLDDLQTNHPSQFDQLLDPAFPAKDYESTLLRDLA